MLAALAGAAWIGRRAWRAVGLRRVVVEGLSMAPTLRPGDRLVLRRPGTLRVGDIVALPDPRRTERIVVKRVRTVTADGLDVRGDNPAASTDSRTFGLVAAEVAIGRAVYRYGPPGRAGTLARWYRAPGGP